MRVSLALAAFTLMAGPAVADKHKAEPLKVTHEPNTYRFGSPYASLPDTKPAACAQVCYADTACSVWVFVPATPERAERCDLKAHIGAVERRPGAISGLAVRFMPSLPDAQTELAGGPNANTAPTPGIKPDIEPEAEEEEDPIFTIDPVKSPAPVILKGTPVETVELKDEPVETVEVKQSAVRKLTYKVKVNETDAR